MKLYFTNMRTKRFFVQLLKRIGLLVFLLQISQFTVAQNLVENGSFEKFYKCPEMPRSIDKNVKLVPAWTWASIDGTTDYFNACSKAGSVGVPNNLMGRSPAMEGDGYVGFILKTHAEKKKDYREYLQTKLLKKLEKDKLYCVSFYYKLATCSRFSIDRLGIYFGENESKAPTNRTLKFPGQLENPKGNFLDNTDKWIPFYHIYRATGKEQFMVIGNFHPDTETSEQPNVQTGKCDSRKDYAYYYIDSVQVMQLQWECEPCPCIPQDLKVEIERAECFNGGTDLLAVVSGGTEPYRQFKWENNSTSRFFKHAITGEHAATVIDDWGCEVSETISYDCGQPLTAEVIESGYTGGHDGFIKLKVKGGIGPFKYKWSNGATTKDINGLAFGNYIYTITDNQGVTYTDTVTFNIPKLTVEAESHYTDSVDGFIRLHVKTGLPPYKYQWQHGDTIPNLDSLSAGTYIYTVTDAAEQTQKGEIKFVAPIKVAVKTGYTFEEDGFINLDIKGGCPPYKIKWSNDSTVANMKFLDNGLYRYNIVGACGKTATDTVRIKGTIILNNVLFKTGSAVLLEASFPELDKVVVYMNRKTKIKVEISGHTDDVGSDTNNEKLSGKRAKSVVEYLVTKGIAQERLVSVGYGEARPVTTNETKEGRAQNRRVEFGILD